MRELKEAVLFNLAWSWPIIIGFPYFSYQIATKADPYLVTLTKYQVEVLMDKVVLYYAANIVWIAGGVCGVIGIGFMAWVGLKLYRAFRHEKKSAKLKTPEEIKHLKIMGVFPPKKAA